MRRPPVYIVCSPRPDVGKTILARLLTEFLLLQNGANPKLLDASQKSPLSYARAANDSMTIHLLEEALQKMNAPAKRKGPKLDDSGFKEFKL